MSFIYFCPGCNQKMEVPDEMENTFYPCPCCKVNCLLTKEVDDRASRKTQKIFDEPIEKETKPIETKELKKSWFSDFWDDYWGCGCLVFILMIPFFIIFFDSCDQKKFESVRDEAKMAVYVIAKAGNCSDEEARQVANSLGIDSDRSTIDEEQGRAKIVGDFMYFGELMIFKGEFIRNSDGKWECQVTEDMVSVKK